ADSAGPMLPDLPSKPAVSAAPGAVVSGVPVDAGSPILPVSAPVYGSPYGPGFAPPCAPEVHPEVYEGGYKEDESPFCLPSSTFKWIELRTGASLYVLRPYYENNPAYTATTLITPPPPGIEQMPTTRSVNFDPRFSVSPLVWFGLTFYDAGVGLRGRYFAYQQGSEDVGAINAPTATDDDGTRRRTTIIPPTLLPDPRANTSSPTPFRNGVSLFGSP